MTKMREKWLRASLFQQLFLFCLKYVKIMHETVSDNFYLMSIWVVFDKKAKKSTVLNWNLKIINWLLSNLHHFPAFSFFKTSLFLAEKKSIGGMVNIWVLKTAYTILLWNKTHYQLIPRLCVILLASEWALPPPHFRAFSIFGRIIFQAEKKSIGDIVHIWLLKTA